MSLCADPPSLRALLHDEATYQDPDAFNPSRFLGPNPEPDPELHGSFGFGKRLCPGRHLAKNTMFIFTAMMLWAFEEDKDEESRDGQASAKDLR